MKPRAYIITESFKRFGFDPALAYIVAGIALAILPFVYAWAWWENRHERRKWKRFARQLDDITAELNRCEAEGKWTL